MEIRPATAEDLPQILALYKLVMGGLSQMRTEAYWKWKHIDNPFGPSPVMLAWDRRELIGQRVFLQWHFLRKGRLINAYRAVDTATHPAHRGKGIFTDLTMGMLRNLEGGPSGLVFNTPNASSKPGYLKMGWQELSRTRLLVCVRPFATLFSGAKSEMRSHAATEFDFSEAEDVISGWQAANAEVMVAGYSPAYLKWRYADIPMGDYRVSINRSADSATLAVYRIKRTRGFRELRVCEALFTGPDGIKLFVRQINALMAMENPDAVTIIDDPRAVLKQALPYRFFRAARLGPVITLRQLNDQELFKTASVPDQWQWSAGTLELF